jgi:hypothetical protein
MQAGQGWRFGAAIGRGVVSTWHSNDNYRFDNPPGILGSTLIIPIPPFVSKLRIAADDLSPVGAGGAGMQFLGLDRTTVIWELSPNGIGTKAGLIADRFVDVAVPRAAAFLGFTGPGVALTTSKLTLEWEGLA